MKFNNKGFSLAEILVGVGLLGILGLVTASFFVFAKKNTVEIENIIEDQVDNIIAERMLLKDLKNADPSFNNILTADDNSRRFFDFELDATEKSIDSSPRKITLKQGGRTQFVFISRTNLSTLMYTPAVAYKIGATPASPNVAASLTFVSLNKDDAVSGYKGVASDPPGKWWTPGMVLMLDTPAMVRQMTATGPNYSRPARSPIYLGVVQSGGPSRLRGVNLSNFLDRTNPMYPNETIDDEDSFLREVPPMGGAAPLVRLKPVNIIMYYLANDPKTKNLGLWRSVYDGSKFASGQLIATGVKEVVFSRKDPHDSLIYFSIGR